MSEIKLMQDIVNGKLIATGKGGEFKNTPWATVVFNVDTDRYGILLHRRRSKARA